MNLLLGVVIGAVLVGLAVWKKDLVLAKLSAAVTWAKGIVGLK